MSYPDDKDEFRKPVGYVSGPVTDDNKVKVGDQVNMANWLENLQDTLGYGIKMGYASMRAFFDFLVNKYTQYVLKAGDTMSGDLDLAENWLKLSGDTMKIKYDANHEGPYFKTSGAKPYLSAEAGIAINANALDDGSGSWVPEVNLRDDGILALSAAADKAVRVHGNVFEPGTDDNMELGILNKRFKSAHVIGDIQVYDNTKGLILNSATKKWRVTINDTGTLVTTQI